MINRNTTAYFFSVVAGPRTLKRDQMSLAVLLEEKSFASTDLSGPDRLAQSCAACVKALPGCNVPDLAISFLLLPKLAPPVELGSVY